MDWTESGRPSSDQTKQIPYDVRRDLSRIAELPHAMQKFSWYVRRLRSMDAAEVLWRMRSLLRDQIDLVRIPLKLYPRLNSTPYHAFRTMQPGFPCTAVDQGSWVRSNIPELDLWQSRLLNKADKIVQNRLSYFNLQDQFHDEPVNWHRDFSAKIDAPMRLAALTDYRNFERVGDCKLVWEPNRHHQLVVLARAYKVTDNLVYARKVVELLESWLKANLFGYGMNWRSPLEAGIRVINWIWAIDLIRPADVFSQHLWNETLESIYIATWDIQRKFSKGSSANNHLVGEAASVYIATSYFRDFPNAGKWRQRSKKILEREILLQSYSDGCTREHAFGYQLFILQFLTLCELASKGTGDVFSADYLNRLRCMYQFLSEISADTGSPPNMGDKDDGYVLDLGELPHQTQELIAVGARLFPNGNLMGQPHSETVFWLFGNLHNIETGSETARSSTAFPESGYFILRADARSVPDTRRMSVFFDCADLGYGPIAAHGHADCLSFGLNVGTNQVMVDPGTFDYFSHPRWREYFRSTNAHNTVEIDGRCQSESLGPFLWGCRAHPTIIDWSDDAIKSSITGEHDGYLRLQDPLIHQRTLTLFKNTQELQVLDRFIAKSSHTALLFFHLDPCCAAIKTSDRSAEISGSDSKLSLTANDGKLGIETAGEDSRLGWISGSYHTKEPSSCIIVSHNFSGNSEITTRISLL